MNEKSASRPEIAPHGLSCFCLSVSPDKQKMCLLCALCASVVKFYEDNIVKDPKTPNSLTGSEIAIIGMAGRFPGAKSIDAFWHNLRDGVESVTFFSDDQLITSGVKPEVLDDPNYVKARPVLEGVELFDAAFFGFNPREAEAMDPQQRLFLECVWEAIENAAYDPETYKGAISLYAGANMSTYLVNNLYANPKAMARAGEYACLLSNIQDSLTTRIAYKLNLKGPCYTVQTFCSTSLVAVHIACQSLLNFECDMAVAGGVSVHIPQNSGYWYLEGMIVSPDGHCRPFDAKAQGTIFGNGLGAVVLKRLEDALAHGDHVEAVIIGSATNNDGSLKVSYTAPSVAGQAEVIVESLANAEANPESISYVETHGTATALGDTTEVAALSRAFDSGTQKKRFCALGSVKSNVGHLDAAAGVASLIKTVLALKNREIPPSPHFERPNPEIDFENSPFYVNSNLLEWKADGAPRRAGVSSFGIGGTNAHLVLEEAPEIEPSSPSRPRQLLLLSAKTKSALDAASANLAAHLTRHPSINIADVTYTLQRGRKAFSYRRYTVCDDATDAVQALKSLDPQRVKTRHIEKRDPEVAFMFPGQGAQYVNMGLNLHDHEPVFRETVDQCAEALEPFLNQDLRDLLYPKGGDLDEAAELLRKTGFQQPAIFTIEYALAKLWEGWGIRPAAMIGHSIGEYVAACLAGVFSLEDALNLVAIRGRMMQELPGGAMLSVRLPAAEIESRLGAELSVAAVNAPSLCVVSGPTERIAQLQGQLEKDDVMCRFLHTSHAFHSPMMDSIVEPFAERVQSVQLSAPKIPFISTATGTWITPAQATDPMYWGRQLRVTVRFAEGIQTLWERPERVLLEVGPRTTCSTLARQQAKDISNQAVIPSLGDTAIDEAEWTAMLNALGQLWLAGVSIGWEDFYEHERRHRLPLPTYPFERKRFWIEPLRRVPGVEAMLEVADQAMQDEDLDSVVSQSTEQPATHLLGADDHDAPRTEPQVLLAAIWQEVLGTDRIGLRDNYFSDLGGDSLSVLRVIEIVRKKTGVRLDPNLFPLNTLRQIAAHLSLQQSPEEPKFSATQADRQPAAVIKSAREKPEIIPLYFGNSQSQLFGIYHRPRPEVAKDVGVLLCYPAFQEYMNSHWAFRRLSSLLSKVGFHVLRFDYFGTGDSAGKSEEGTVGRWKADIRSAVYELRDISGVGEISIVGLRLGATLAAEACAEGLHVKDLVLWDPVVKGRSYVGELKAMHCHRFPALQEQAAEGNIDELLGFSFPLEMRTAIEQIDLIELPRYSVEKISLIVSEQRNEHLQLRDQLSSAGAEFDYHAMISDGMSAKDMEQGDALREVLLPIKIEILTTITAILARESR